MLLPVSQPTEPGGSAGISSRHLAELIVTAVPPGTTEAAVPFVENIRDLPSKAYFQKILDRPHFPDEDEKGIPPWAHRTGPGTLLLPPKTQQTVRSEKDR